MTILKFSDAIGEINDRYILEALEYKPVFLLHKQIKKLWLAVASICLIVGTMLFSHFSKVQSITVYAYGSNQPFENAKTVILSGSIDDNGQMHGHPLQFYILGDDIESIRFSCKNGYISFVDWTEQRGDYGLSKNFTVQYGENKKEYYYLVIDWIPQNIIKKLTDNVEIKISDLSAEEKEDIIIMEVTYLNGKNQTMAINTYLNEDGLFAVNFSDYQITSKDDFIYLPDSQSIEHQP